MKKTSTIAPITSSDPAKPISAIEAATTGAPATTKGSRPPIRVRSWSDHWPAISGTASATAPSAPISRPITVVDSVNCFATSGRYVVTVVIERASPSVGRPRRARKRFSRERRGRSRVRRFVSAVSSTTPLYPREGAAAGVCNPPYRRGAGATAAGTRGRMSTRDGMPTSVFLRPIGSPLGLGMAGLLGASLVVSGIELGWIASNQRGAVGLMLVAFAFPLQFAASLIAFGARDGAAGTALGILSGTWLATGLTFLSSGASAKSGALGLLLLASAVALACAAAGTATGKLVPAAVFALEAVRFVGAGIHELGGGEFWQDAAGIVGLLVVALAAYIVAAAVLEDARGATVLPLARRDRAEHEPGVRA